MKIEELCIGNTVIYNGIECKISDIYSPRPDANPRFADKPVVGLLGLFNVPLEEIEGKEITLDDLSKLGATKNKYASKRYHIKGCVFYDKINKTFYTPYFLELSNITHLHHVENLVKLF